MIVSGRDFVAVWVVEVFCARSDGENPEPLCIAATDLVSGRSVRAWLSEGGLCGPPFFLSHSDLLVCLPAIPLVISFVSLGWPLPNQLIDLHAEFRCLTNGESGVDDSRAGMLRYFGEPFGLGVERPGLEALALKAGHTEDERAALMAYCDQRLAVAIRLFRHLAPHFDGGRTLFRGEFLMAAARVEMAGVPVDAEGLAALYARRAGVCAHLIESHAANYPGVFQRGRFSEDGFAAWLGGRGDHWPRTPTGLLMTDDDTLKDMAARHPDIDGLRHLKKMLTHLATGRIAVGRDGRNRCPTRPFASSTGRNQPPNGQWVFGAPGWMRGFIRPPLDKALALIDYSSQEFGVGAALSGDRAMIAAYASGDPYLALARDTGAVGPNSGPEALAAARKLHKLAVFGILYGMGIESLSVRLGVTPAVAIRIVRGFRDRYRVFCAWQESVTQGAYEEGWIGTSLGWRRVVTPRTSRRAVGNYLLQATASDILRVAVYLAVGRGVKVCATIHDCLLIESDATAIDDAVACAAGAMREAGEWLLGGLSLRTGIVVAAHPDRLLTTGQRPMWERVRAAVESAG